MDTIKVMLAPNLPAYGSVSMQRYQKELGSALNRNASSNQSIDEITFPAHTFAYSSVENALLRRWLLRFDRWITYPLLLKRYSPNVMHILDHSHAQLLRHVHPNSRKVITCHDLIPLKAIRGELSLNYHSLQQSAYLSIINTLATADHIIADSQATELDLQRLLGIDSKKISVIYPGKNRTFCPLQPHNSTRNIESLRTKLGLPKAGKLILHVGTDSPYKNTVAIVRALPRVLAHIDTWFVNVGAPLSPAAWGEAQNSGITERIIPIGKVPGDDLLLEYYRVCDLLVFPSIYEGFGWPPLESMSSGTPVVASTAPALREVVGDAGLFVDPLDHRALADAIMRILAEPGLRELLATRGLEQAGKFDWDRTAKQTIAVYESLLQ